MYGREELILFLLWTITLELNPAGTEPAVLWGGFDNHRPTRVRKEVSKALSESQILSPVGLNLGAIQIDAAACSDK